MGLFSRTSTTISTKTSTSVAASRGSRIQTVDRDRPEQPYTAEPQDTDIPPFTRKGSYYYAKAEDPDYKYLEASDVRRQVQQAPTGPPPLVGYLKPYGNRLPVPLSADPPYRDYPVVPSPRNGSAPRNYTGDKPGPVRAFYNDSDRTRFDVGYHDSSRPPVAPRNGRPHMSNPYSLAEYHPAPTYTDTRNVRGR